MVDFKADERLNTLNHSCAHVMAQAVKHLYPHAKFWVGPVVKEGFYYDIDLGNDVVNDEVIAAIEKEMKKICKEGKKIYRREVSKAEAMEMFKDDEYKLDLISNLEDGTITCYEQGDFTDLCRGPHVDNVKLCRNFKLLRHSGAYWKGDSNNKVLQRIYGVCFPTPEELEAHLQELEEAKERDHRKIGKDMELFMVDDLIGRGLPMFLPKGYTVWQELENYIKAKSAYDNAYKEQQKLPQLREELHEINVQLDMAEQENKIISEKLIEARENYSSLAAQYKSACAQMEKDIHDTSALEKRLTELKRFTDEYSLVSEKLSQEVSLSAQKLAAASTSHEAAVSEEKAAVQKLTLAKEAAEKVLAENNLPPADEFVPDRENISRLPELNERLKQFVSALSDAAKRQEELSGELSGKERPDIASLKKLRDSADAKCSELDFNIRSTEENIKRLTDLAADCRKRMEVLNARREIYARQREFADMMSGAKGISFTRYVLGVMLDMVTDEANNMLANMLDGTFRLVRSKEVGGGSKQGLDLMVESALAEHSASYPTAQLSGGEKFLISLVLGVALSTVVQSRFGGISIDAMFIDEGFGSLDPAALADAVKVIYTIQGSRRKVGIISHVDKLKEEIPCCINVKKDRHGSSLSY